MSDTLKLSACKCGGEATRFRSEDGDAYWIECAVCRASTPECKTADEAAAAWERMQGVVDPVDLEDLIERLLDAQQDINFEANSRMSQPLCDASALIDEIETALRKLSSRPADGAEARIAELEAALEPFDDVLGEDDGDEPDHTQGTLVIGRNTYYMLTLGDLRRVRSALSAASAGKGE